MPAPARPRRRAVAAATLAAVVAMGAGGPAALAADPSPGPSPTALPGSDAGVTPPATPQPGPTTEPAPDPTVDPSPAPDPSPDPSPSPDPDPGSPADPTPDPTPDPSAGPSPTPDPSAWPGRLNLYRKGAWVRQYWDYTCTAASTQTMLNLILGRSDRSADTQQRIIRYARRHDTLTRSRGSDPEGWARALTRFGGGSYGWRRFSTRAAALRHAASRMVATGKPVGLLVWRGRHAWTMTGFTSATDPSVDGSAAITGIFVAPPLRGIDPEPNAYLPAGELGAFRRYRERDGLRAWVGYWVVVSP